MPKREPNTQLAALLTEIGWSAGDLARRVNAAGAAHGVRLRYDRTAVAHWLGGTRPRHPVPALVASVLSHGSGRSISPEEIGLTPVPAPGPLVRRRRPEAVDAAQCLRDLCRADLDPTRHAALARSVYSPTAVDGRASASRAPTNPPRLVGRVDAGRAASRTARELTQTFADLSARHGGRRIRAWLALYLARDAGHLPAASDSPRLHAQLLVDVAQLTHLLAETTADSGHPGLARAYFEIALDLADEADDDRMHAITLRAMSVQAMRLGHHEHAFRLADAAVERAGTAPDAAVLAFLLTQRAHSGAIIGRRHRARADLRAAEHHHDRSTALPGPFTSYTPAARHFRSGQALRALGEIPNAIACLEAARSRGPLNRRATALTEATLAETLADIGHLEAACAHWNVFLDLRPHLDSAEIERARARMHEALHRFPHQRDCTRLRQREQALESPTASRSAPPRADAAPGHSATT
ncbi:hypothetical protein B4N89_36125 [Embleya scabrispora]|uniref:Transcriptional regulator n=1 Tax=Embleya scabrispora TaxID=159449 RepID=A0A1T3NLS4_9ACTN|nr:hypothetical protein [Embleya scabrispora]OPC77724.1 hypothetical protein B4N89_36125 [Embleya scabrispora]